MAQRQICITAPRDDILPLLIRTVVEERFHYTYTEILGKTVLFKSFTTSPG